MSFSDLWKTFRLLSDPDSLPPELRPLLHDFLATEYQKRQAKRIQHLMNQSGIKRIKLLSDFDWTFNPKIPRDKLLDYLHSRFLKSPSNLVLIGPAGVGKSHLATAFCHDALSKGVQTLFISLFDLAARIDRSQHPASLIDHYARVPLLCLDEIGYALPTREQADAIFQIVSKRSEIATTLVTTNLVPSQWGKIFDSTTASAILDRLSMNGRFITLEGRSYRSKQ
jgi:DNA replication protein DnaC